MTETMKHLSNQLRILAHHGVEFDVEEVLQAARGAALRAGVPVVLAADPPCDPLCLNPDTGECEPDCP